MSRHSVGLFVATLLVAAAFTPVAAQHSSGNITGDGKAGDGKYPIPRVPTGIYVVTVTHGDGTVERPREVRVQVGTTARVK